MRLMNHSNEAGSKEVSNLKANRQGVISGAREIEVITVNKGRHTMRMGLNRTIKRPNSGYNPTQGLISLFSKTGTRRQNPKVQPGLTMPQTTQQLHPHHSYANVVRSKMEGADSLAMVPVVECATMGLVGSAARRKGIHLLVQGTSGHINGMAAQGRMEAEEVGGATMYMGEAMVERIGKLIFGQGTAISGSAQYRQGRWGQTCMEGRLIKVIRGSQIREHYRVIKDSQNRSLEHLKREENRAALRQQRE
jgi:hypothetical protein